MNRAQWMAVAASLGLGALFLAQHRRAVAGEGGPLSKAQIRDMAAQVIGRYGFNVSPEVAANIAMIESSGNPLALRYESYIPHLGGPDYSTGLMQVLTSTATDLARNMGYDAYGRNPGRDAMLDPWVSLYFGCAYLDWLSTYGGQNRSVAWIVQSYNAGPGRAMPAYLTKYNAEAAR